MQSSTRGKIAYSLKQYLHLRAEKDVAATFQKNDEK
jgi:hypothetical protein